MAARKPAPKPAPQRRPAPRPQPIDMVREPGFGSAMANQNYANLMAYQQARLAAQGGDFTQGRLMGAPTNQPRPSPEPMINPETIKKARDEYYASQPKNRKYRDVMTNSKYGGQFESSIGSGFDKWFETNYINNPNSPLSAQERMTLDPRMGAPTEQPNPNAGKPLYFQALEGELQKQFLDKNPQLKPKPGTAFNQQLMQENYAKFLQNQMAEVNKFNVANPQYAQDIRKPNPILARQSEQSFLEGLLDYSKVSPSQVNVLNQLKSSYLNEGQGGGTQPSIPPGGGIGGPAPDQNAENIQRAFGRYALGVNKLMQEQPQQGPEPISTIAGPRPSGQMNPQKMQAFQNFLNQGMQRSNTMNQDAAAGFANPQPGMQGAIPAVPVAGIGMGMQQPRQALAPRKFSTVSNTPARFG